MSHTKDILFMVEVLSTEDLEVLINCGLIQIKCEHLWSAIGLNVFMVERSERKKLFQFSEEFIRMHINDIPWQVYGNVVDPDRLSEEFKTELQMKGYISNYDSIN